MNAAIMNKAFKVRVADFIATDDEVMIDHFVLRHPKGTPFHTVTWSQAIESSCGHRTKFLVAEDGAGTIAGILPLTRVTSLLFGDAMVSSGFAVGGGLLCANALAEKQLIAAALSLAKAEDCPSIELRGGPLPKGDQNGWIEDHDTYVGFSRTLAADDEAELLNIPRKQRAEVRKALGFDLTVETGNAKRDRDAHYKVYSTSVRNLGTPVFPRALFEEVLNEFGDAADILTVRREGRAIASVLSLYHNGVVMPYWGGGTADARTWRANDLMYYALMCHARTNKGAKTFDFGRSKVGTGPAAFKKNWGFEAVPLSYAKWAAEGEAPREINPNNPKYKARVAMWQKLPLWVANLIGPTIAKGLG